MKRLLLITIILLAGALFATETSFADSLFARGEYYRAITEYYRIMFSGQETAYCHSQIVNSYLAGSDYEGLLDYLETGTSPADHLYKTMAHIKNDRADLAAILNDNPDSQQHLLLFALCNSYIGRFDVAEQSLMRLSNPELSELKDLVHTANKETASLGYRSPFVAGALGIVPGLGYAYGGAWQTALSALVTNALLFGVTFELSQEELYFSSAALGVASLGFYLGGIYGSVSHTAKRNKAIRKQNLDKYLDPLFLKLLKLQEQ